MRAISECVQSTVTVHTVSPMGCQCRGSWADNPVLRSRTLRAGRLRACARHHARAAVSRGLGERVAILRKCFIINESHFICRVLYCVMPVLPRRGVRHPATPVPPLLPRPVRPDIIRFTLDITSWKPLFEEALYASPETKLSVELEGLHSERVLGGLDDWSSKTFVTKKAVLPRGRS